MTVNDTEWKFLAEQTGMSAPFNDMYFHYLRGLGYVGTLQDMIAASGLGFTPSKGGVVPVPTIQDIFGNDLRLAVEPWFRPDLTVESGGYIGQITDSKAGVVFSQGVGSAQPSSTMGARKIPAGDGVDDTLQTSTMGWAPSSNFSSFGFGGCWLDPSVDTSIQCLTSFGNTQAQAVWAQRRASNTPSNAFTGLVSAVVSSANLPEADIGTGGFTWWMDIEPSSADVYINGVFAATLSVTAALTLSRSRLFANSATTASLFAKLSLGGWYVTNLATTDQRNDTMAILADAASQITQ